MSKESSRLLQRNRLVGEEEHNNMCSREEQYVVFATCELLPRENIRSYKDILHLPLWK
jgi:hypothetical protein